MRFFEAHGTRFFAFSLKYAHLCAREHLKMHLKMQQKVVPDKGAVDTY